jgi:hypothetical protein
MANMPNANPLPMKEKVISNKKLSTEQASDCDIWDGSAKQASHQYLCL